MLEWITQPEAWVGLVMLTTLEIVLGIDNIVFIAILAAKLPEPQQPRARRIGLLLAMFSRIALLFSLAWVIGLQQPLDLPIGIELTGRDLILILGGLFLLAKSVTEIHDKLEGEEGHASAKVTASMGHVLLQIVMLDLVFSLDSVITAVGMVDELEVMVLAVVIAVMFMMVFAETISAFIERHPTVKMLALSFLLMIGMTLMVEGLGIHIPKGYIYFAMAFAVFVEMLNLQLKGRSPVRLHQPYVPDEPPDVGRTVS